MIIVLFAYALAQALENELMGGLYYTALMPRVYSGCEGKDG